MKTKKSNEKTLSRVAQNITTLVKDHGLTMRELSEHIPVPYTYLHCIEKGEIPGRMTFCHLKAISEFLGENVFKLLNLMLPDEIDDD